MGDINLKAALGGQIVLTPTNTASNYTATFPAVTGVVSVQASASYTTGSVLFVNSSGQIAQDNANFFWDDTNNRLSVGSSSNVQTGSFTPTFQVSASGAAASLSAIRYVSPGGGGAIVALGSSRAAVGSGATSALTSGDGIGTFGFYGADGTNFVNSCAQIVATVDGAVSTGIVPTRLTFTTMDSAGSVSERMRIDSSGNVGIGATNGDSRLYVKSTSAGTVDFKVAFSPTDYFGISSQSDGYQLASVGGTNALRFAAGGAERARIDSSGNVNINNASQLTGNAKLSIWNTAGSSLGFATGYGTGTSQFRLIYLTSAANALNFDNGANNATLSSAGAWTNASDAKLKKNIEDIKYGLATVNETKPRSFNRVDVEGDYIGFVAQELEEIIPEVVWQGDKNLTVDYGSLVAVAFKAIQELSAKLDAAEARIAALEGAK